MSTMPTRPLPSAPPEIVVAVKPEAKANLTLEGLTVAPPFDEKSLNDIVSSPQTTLKPLFGLSEARLNLKTQELAKQTGGEPLNLSRFYRLQAPENQVQELMDRLSEQPAVDAVFRRPGAVPAIWFSDMVADPTPVPPEIPDFSETQRYLNPGPIGIDAEFAWKQPGGKGTGICIVDVEGAWRFSHQDLKENQGGVIGGVVSDLDLWRNHGTAVIGIFSGDDNGKGVNGICPEAHVSGVSIFGPQESWGIAAAIFLAADKLPKGGILLLELQVPGPATNFEENEGQTGYIPVEWWPDCLDAIQYATRKGVVVVSAAGNGGQNLDSPIFDQGPQPPHKAFPESWSNPFRRGDHDSGSILVGAGAAPPIQGLTTLSDRSRLTFSNFGSIVDAQGWGQLVTTCGFGNTKHGGGPDEDFWFTRTFSGTSSAAAMIAGTLGCVQGVLKANGLQLLTSQEARSLLRETGAKQEGDAVGERIGTRPDLSELIPLALKVAKPVA